MERYYLSLFPIVLILFGVTAFPKIFWGNGVPLDCTTGGVWGEGCAPFPQNLYVF